MQIQSIQKEYIQKSRIFLYPTLGIRRGSSVTPVETYLAWQGRFAPEDCKLICVYHFRTDPDYKIFEKTHLIGNKYYMEHHDLEDDSRVYVFDLTPIRDDVSMVVQGKYSKTSLPFKQQVLDFFKNHIRHYTYVWSYLDPSKFFEDYARLLGVRVEVVKRVGELCDKPNFEKETLVKNTKVFTFEPIKSLNKSKL